MIWKLTTLHAEFTNLLVVGIFVELHGTGEDEGQPGGKQSDIRGYVRGSGHLNVLLASLT